MLDLQRPMSDNDTTAKDNIEQLFAEFVAVMEAGAKLKSQLSELRVENLSLSQLCLRRQKRIDDLEQEVESLECGGSTEGDDDYDLSSYMAHIPPIHRESVLDTVDALADKMGAIPFMNHIEQLLKNIEHGQKNSGNSRS